MGEANEALALRARVEELQRTLEELEGFYQTLSSKYSASRQREESLRLALRRRCDLLNDARRRFRDVMAPGAKLGFAKPKTAAGVQTELEDSDSSAEASFAGRECADGGRPRRPPIATCERSPKTYVVSSEWFARASSTGRRFVLQTEPWKSTFVTSTIVTSAGCSTQPPANLLGKFYVANRGKLTTARQFTRKPSRWLTMHLNE